jgi:hypothetical protein
MSVLFHGHMIHVPKNAYKTVRTKRVLQLFLKASSTAPSQQAFFYCLQDLSGHEKYLHLFFFIICWKQLLSVSKTCIIRQGWKDDFVFLLCGSRKILFQIHDNPGFGSALVWKIRKPQANRNKAIIIKSTMLCYQ